MQETVPPKWEGLEALFPAPTTDSLIATTINLVLGGLIAVYLRFLYKRTSTPSSTDSIARVFPLLTIVTVAIITVVKSSITLSLGLVGALSIVRFRAAIKDPEELTYLFLCIGVGLSLGANQLWLAFALVVVATVFVLIFDRLAPFRRTGDAYLTIVGDASKYFAGDTALNAARELCPHLSVQRCDIDGDEGQLRVLVHRLKNDAASGIVAGLRERLPECQISYVSAETLL